MSSQAKMRTWGMIFGVILIIIGGVMLLPASAWSSFSTTQLASIGTGQYDATLLMQLYPQGSDTPLQRTYICGSKDPTNWQSYQSSDALSGKCYSLNLVGSTLDPWAVYDVGSLAPNTMVYAAGSLTKNIDGSRISGVQIDISWYPAVLQTSSGFNVYQLATKTTGSDGIFQTAPFPIPSQANNEVIVIFAEVYKGPYSAWVGCETTNKGLCFDQSEHYKVSVGQIQGTALSIWVGSGCAYGSSYPSGSSCTQVYRDGSDVISPSELSVTLPFKIIAVATQGPEPPAVYVHAKSYPLGQPSPPYEVSSFPAPMGSSVQVTRPDGQVRKVYVLYVGGSGCQIGGNPNSGGCDVQLPPGRYDVLFTTTIDYPWALSTVNVLAIIHIGSASNIINPSTWTWSLTLMQDIGGLFVIFGFAVIGVVMVQRKHP